MIDSFKGKYFFLSNYHKCKVPYDGIEYSSSESAFQAAKTLDNDKRQVISKLSPSESKKIGRTICIRPDWENEKDNVMNDVCYQKFSSNDELKKKLLETGDEELIEGNTWHDNYWGNCTCDKCKDITGRNQLGKTLMSIRERLKSEKDN